MALATRGLLLWASRSNITDSSFCCTFWSPRAEKNGLVICRETAPQCSDTADSLSPTLSAHYAHVCSDWAHLFQGSNLAAGNIGVLLGRGPQSSDEQIQTILVLGQQGGRSLVILPQDQVHELGLSSQQGGGIRAALLQEAIQDRKQGRQGGLRGKDPSEGAVSSNWFQPAAMFLPSPVR